MPENIARDRIRAEATRFLQSKQVDLDYEPSVICRNRQHRDIVELLVEFALVGSTTTTIHITTDGHRGGE
jgi:hypothetical protein